MYVGIMNTGTRKEGWLAGWLDGRIKVKGMEGAKERRKKVRQGWI